MHVIGWDWVSEGREAAARPQALKHPGGEVEAKLNQLSPWCVTCYLWWSEELVWWCGGWEWGREKVRRGREQPGSETFRLVSCVVRSSRNPRGNPRGNSRGNCRIELCNLF